MYFDTSCEFYLGLIFEELFEQTGRQGEFTFRCKGCQEMLSGSDREKHHKQHVREFVQSKKRRAAQAAAARAKNLAKARAAKGVKR